MFNHTPEQIPQREEDFQSSNCLIWDHSHQFKEKIKESNLFNKNSTVNDSLKESNSTLLKLSWGYISPSSILPVNNKFIISEYQNNLTQYYNWEFKNNTTCQHSSSESNSSHKFNIVACLFDEENDNSSLRITEQGIYFRIEKYSCRRHSLYTLEREEHWDLKRGYWK